MCFWRISSGIYIKETCVYMVDFRGIFSGNIKETCTSIAGFRGSNSGNIKEIYT